MMNIEKFPKVTVILRGYTYSQTRTVVKNLVGTCLGSVEITMNTPGALESIRKGIWSTNHGGSRHGPYL